MNFGLIRGYETYRHFMTNEADKKNEYTFEISEFYSKERN